MAGLVPAIHVLASQKVRRGCPGTSGAKTRFALLPGHDEERVAALTRQREKRSRSLFFSPIAVVMPVMTPVAMMPRPIAADLARAVMGPDHPAVAVRIIIRRVVGRRVIEAPMQMMPVVGVAIAAGVIAAEAAVTNSPAVER